jgi:hypothetical protein
VASAAGLKGRDGDVLTASDFDFYNRDTTPPKEPTVQDFMRVLGGRKKG